jgi:hypothetical protein
MSEDKLKLLYNKMFIQPTQEEDAVIEDVLPAAVEEVITPPKAMIKGTTYTTYRPTMEEFERLFGDFYQK